MSERKSKPVTKNTIPNRPRLGLRGLGQVQVFAHNSLRTLTQQSSQKGITETENSQSLLRNQGSKPGNFGNLGPDRQNFENSDHFGGPWNPVQNKKTHLSMLSIFIINNI